MNATPRPWEITNEMFGIGGQLVTGIVAGNNYPVANLGTCEPGKANAELIVRAVNSFDELMADREYMKKYRDAYCRQTQVIDAMREALEAIVARIDGDFDHAALVKQGVLTLDSKADIKGFAKAALALAKGER